MMKTVIATLLLVVTGSFAYDTLWDSLGRFRRPPRAGIPTTCEIRAATARGRLGEFVPKCKADGSYEAKQCWASTGYCWCVKSATGKEITGTRSRGHVKCGKPTTCEIRAAKATGRRGEFIPKCKADGSYEVEQCWASTGYCWCVKPASGNEIPGTRSRGHVKCGIPTTCELRAAKARGRLGEFIPKCKADGSYEAKQCWASTGYCWCVKPASGNEIPGTRSRGHAKCGYHGRHSFEDDYE